MPVLKSLARLGLQGEPVARINKAFRSLRRAAELGADVVPHTLRHTCATWLAQSGVPVWEAAGFLGISPETLERVYGHHHPDYQALATGATFRSVRQIGDRYQATNSEHRPLITVKKGDKT